MNDSRTLNTTGVGSPLAGAGWGVAQELGTLTVTFKKKRSSSCGELSGRSVRFLLQHGGPGGRVGGSLEGEAGTRSSEQERIV